MNTSLYGYLVHATCYPERLAGLCRDAGVDMLDLAAEWRACDREPEEILAGAGVSLPRFCDTAT